MEMSGVVAIVAVGGFVALAIGIAWCAAIAQRRRFAAAMLPTTSIPGAPVVVVQKNSAATEFLLTFLQMLAFCCVFSRGGSSSGRGISLGGVPKMRFNFHLV